MKLRNEIRFHCLSPKPLKCLYPWDTKTFLEEFTIPLILIPLSLVHTAHVIVDPID